MDQKAAIPLKKIIGVGLLQKQGMKWGDFWWGGTDNFAPYS